MSGETAVRGAAATSEHARGTGENTARRPARRRPCPCQRGAGSTAQRSASSSSRGRKNSERAKRGRHPDRSAPQARTRLRAAHAGQTALAFADRGKGKGEEKGKGKGRRAEKEFLFLRPFSSLLQTPLRRFRLSPLHRSAGHGRRTGRHCTHRGGFRRQGRAGCDRKRRKKRRPDSRDVCCSGAFVIDWLGVPRSHCCALRPSPGGRALPQRQRERRSGGVRGAKERAGRAERSGRRERARERERKARRNQTSGRCRRERQCGAKSAAGWETGTCHARAVRVQRAARRGTPARGREGAMGDRREKGSEKRLRPNYPREATSAAGRLAAGAVARDRRLDAVPCRPCAALPAARSKGGTRRRRRVPLARV